MRNALACLFTLLSLATAQAATQCNPPAGWLIQNGTIPVGDFLSLGPNCGEVQDGGNAVATLPVSSGNVSYTAPGTGGATSTQTQYNQRVLYAADYGAVCNGVANDTTAFTNLIAEAITLGAPARFAGSCVVNNITVANTVSVDFAGLVPGSSVLLVNAGQNGFTFTGTAPVFFHDFGMTWPASETVSNGFNQTLSSGALNGSKFYHVNLSGPFVGYNLTRISGTEIIDGTIINVPNNGTGLIIDNLNNCSVGSNIIARMDVETLANAADYVILRSGAETRVIDSHFGGTTTDGIVLDLDAGCSASDLIISGNHIDGFLSTSDAIILERASSSGTFFNANVTNNTIFGPVLGIVVPTDASGQWLFGLNVSNNAIALASASGATGIFINSAGAITTGYNTMISNLSTTIKYNLGSAATNCFIGPVEGQGTFAASINTPSCTTTAPF